MGYHAILESSNISVTDSRIVQAIHKLEHYTTEMSLHSLRNIMDTLDIMKYGF